MNGFPVVLAIAALCLGVTALIGGIMLKLQRLKNEEARLRGGSGPDEELAHQVTVLQQEMAELQERVDFSERMLAQLKDAPALPRPKEPPA